MISQAFGIALRFIKCLFPYHFSRVSMLHSLSMLRSYRSNIEHTLKFACIHRTQNIYTYIDTYKYTHVRVHAEGDNKTKSRLKRKKNDRRVHMIYIYDIANSLSLIYIYIYKEIFEISGLSSGRLLRAIFPRFSINSIVVFLFHSLSRTQEI